MSATEITAVFGVLVALASSVIVPLLLRRQDHQQKEREADDAAETQRAERSARMEEQETVTLKSINEAVWNDREAIKKDRDEITARSETREEAHRTEIKQLEKEHQVAIGLMRSECEEKIQGLRKRITELEKEVANLYRAQGRAWRTIGDET